MAGICTATASPNNCSHRTVDIARGGVTRTYHLEDVDEPLTEAEERQLDALTIRKLRSTGVTLAQFLNRVTYGEEATNVKMYSFFGPGAAITKTNIGTAYVNIPPGLNGERIAADFTGCTQYRVRLWANLIGTGQWGARIVRDGDSSVLHEAANLGAAGERELDTDWQNLPAAFQGQGLTLLRAQGKSTTAADDPVFRGCVLGLR